MLKSLPLFFTFCQVSVSFDQQHDTLVLESNSPNLISNGSFEEKYSCPSESIDIEQCKYWVSPIPGSTPEYICSSCPKQQGTINTETPFGNCYIRLITRLRDCYSAVEPIQGELSEPLIKDSVYQLSFYYRREDISKYYLDRWSVLFSRRQGENYSIDLVRLHEVLSSKMAIKIEINDQGTKPEWRKVTCSFVARGGENFITIGVFLDHMKGKYRKDKNYIVDESIKGTISHYYLDNFVLSPVRSN